MTNADFIPVNRPLLDGNEKKYLIECIESGWISSEGPFVKNFEVLFSQKVGRKYGVAVSNGSVAIDIAITALGIEKDDEVIMPTFTIISCINQIIRVGAKPIFIDSDPITWNMDVSQIENKITPRTKAIMIVHIYGLPVDVDPILQLAKKYNLKIIEDAAEMHGQTYKGKPCGSFGDISTFSFYPNKHITTGEGGMIVTDNEELFEQCCSYRDLCFNPKKRRFLHYGLGWNARMTNMQAAIGLAQLERIDDFIVKKRHIGKLYNELLCQIGDGVILPLQKTDYAENIYWVYGVVLKASVPANAQVIMGKLNEVGIGTRPFFYPMHLQPVFQENGMFKDEEYPNAEMLAEQGFYIPSGLGLSDLEIRSVADKVNRTIRNL